MCFLPKSKFLDPRFVKMPNGACSVFIRTCFFISMKFISMVKLDIFRNKYGLSMTKLILSKNKHGLSMAKLDLRKK